MAPSLYKIAAFLDLSFSHFNLLPYPLEEAPFLKNVPRGTFFTLSFQEKVLWLFKNLPATLNVPRGTFSDETEAVLEKLKIYEALLKEWQPKINLISRTETADIWERHFLDSLQILPFLQMKPRSLIDIGSGAGFPGLLLAIVGISNITLVESIAKKCLFLAEVAKETGCNVQVLNKRLEDVKGLEAPDYITARAVAPLHKLLTWAYPFTNFQTKLVFLKGKQANEEVKVASQKWLMHIKKEPSITHEEGVILQITNLKGKK